MTWTAPRTWVAGEVVTAAVMNTHLRDNFKALGDAWTAYTPTWTTSATSPTIGNGTIAGAYMQAGKLVSFRVTITMGSTTTYGTGNYQVSPPVAPASARWRFATDLLDLSGSAAVSGTALHSGGSLFLFTTPATAGAFDRNVTATVPFVFATGDIITINGTYEAA